MYSIGVALVSIIFITTVVWVINQRRAAVSSISRRKHPPGPRPLPIIGNLHMLGTLPHRSLNDLSKKYGPIMFLKLGNVPTVVISSVSGAELILKTHDAIFADRARNDAVENITGGSNGITFATYGPLWRNNKKFVTQELFTAAKIESFAATRREEIERWVKSIRAAGDGGEEVDLTSEVEKVIENITNRMLFGCSGDDNKHDLKCVFEIMSLIGVFNIADYIPCLKLFDLQGLEKKLNELGKRADKLFAEIINDHEHDERNGTEKKNKDIVDMMLATQKNSSSLYTLNLKMMKALLFDIIAGSVDTSHTWIGWTLTEIMRHPRVMKCLQEELRVKVGLNKMVEEKDLSHLKYLEIVIMESLRLHPVTPLLVPRKSMEDIELNGYFIPKNTRVWINSWAIGHDPKIWSENVECFIPERFLNKQVDLRGHDFHLLPFGYGRRICPGMNLGLINVKLIIAQLMHCFNWELPSGISPHEVDMTETFGLTTQKTKNLVALPSYRLLS